LRRAATTEAIRKQYEENPKKRFDLATAARPSATYGEVIKAQVEA
jgi:RNA:NAD 2'-phosphotransferase (TPT1/KptA family)